MAPRKIFAGASGYSFKEWRGIFYPERMKAEAMLPWYAERLPTVEINNTFYRMPRREVLDAWARSTPASFRFAVKAPRRITHLGRLDPEKTAEPVRFLYECLGALGAKRGPVLFQLPPQMAKDASRLLEFLQRLPPGHYAAFEFRNDSWFDDQIFDALKQAGAALCLSEREDSAPPPMVETAPWGYVRLRLQRYSEQELELWARRLQSGRWGEVFVYFMHEPTAPAYAGELMRLAQGKAAARCDPGD